MSRESLAEALARLDALVRRHWGMPLLVATGNDGAMDDGLAYLQARRPDTGFDFNIGGNSFELVGRRHLDQIQYQFADRDEVSETNATIFITQQDLFSGQSRADIARLRETLLHMKTNRYLPLVGAVTGLAVVGIGYGIGCLVTEAFRQKPTEKWAEKIQRRTGAAGRNL